jgi:hypothetical protein
MVKVLCLVLCTTSSIQQQLACCNFVYFRPIHMHACLGVDRADCCISNIAAADRLLSLQQPTDSTRGTTGCDRLLMLYCLLIEVPLLAAWIATS